MLEGMLDSLDLVAPVADGGVNEAEQPPRLGQESVVPLALGLRDDPLDLADDIARQPSRSSVTWCMTKRRVSTTSAWRPMCPLQRGSLHRLVELDAGPRELAGLHERLAEQRQQLETAIAVHLEEIGRAPEEVGGGRHVAAREGAPAGRGEPRRRPQPQVAPVVVERPQLGEVAVRLLEVVAEDLLVLGLAVALAVHALRPVDEALVKCGPRALEDAVVRRVSDQEMVEAERAPTDESGGVCADEVLLHQRGAEHG